MGTRPLHRPTRETRPPPTRETRPPPTWETPVSKPGSRPPTISTGESTGYTGMGGSASTTATTPITPGGCYEEDTGYPGSINLNQGTGATTDKQNSAAECQELCAQTKDCQFFAWNKN